ncbi:hypothetical protein NDI85_19990 [Halomicroarcula sp. S1AR25-4]|uniref:hypothetical protein n=1 Tax=Haloarcula sp. S1AR25-4 TaxID=2950538 RepID=UPI0028743D0E|nr:hypothetical protein [Halomicroarcula sp. S1AR25-4]MDS0280070.1 hypothetical protein [Halomicroarcula sp. S1AR25-4]
MPSETSFTTRFKQHMAAGCALVLVATAVPGGLDTETTDTTTTTDLTEGATLSDYTTEDITTTVAVGPTCEECESLDVETVDRVWAGPSAWDRRRYCRDCGYIWEEATEEGLVDLSPSKRSKHVEDVHSAYVHGRLSDEALERSLDRVFGLCKS